MHLAANESASAAETVIAFASVLALAAALVPTTLIGAQSSGPDFDGTEGELPEALALTGPTNAPIALVGAASVALGLLMVLFDRRRTTARI